MMRIAALALGFVCLTLVGTSGAISLGTAAGGLERTMDLTDLQPGEIAFYDGSRRLGVRAVGNWIRRQAMRTADDQPKRRKSAPPPRVTCQCRYCYAHRAETASD